MTVLLDVCSMPHISGLPEDACQNAWVFSDAAATDTEVLAALIAGRVQDFYTAVSGYFANCVTRSIPSSQTFYDITGHLTPTPGAGHGSPVATDTLTLASASSATALPSEVAAVLSFHGDLTGIPIETGAIRPAARRSGRVYLGPLNISATDNPGAFAECRPNATFRTAVTNAAHDLLADTAGGTWMVWSRAGGFLTPVAGGYMDDAWDTQRRRGPAATGRTTFT